MSPLPSVRTGGSPGRPVHSFASEAVRTFRILNRRRLAVFAAWLVAAGALTAAGSSWQAGTAREKITPDDALWMTGYGARTHPAEGTAQDLWVKALAVADPAGNRGVLLTLDLCGITREISDRVAGEISRRHGLPRSAVMTNVSHTHCGPWIEGNLIGMAGRFPPEGLRKASVYRRQLEEKMIRAASAALESLSPATLSWGEDAATFGFNRRENPEKDVPTLRAAGKLRGPTDPRVPVLAVRGPDGAVRGLLVSYACHNTTLGFYQWHGDYAGCMQVELERRHPKATVMFTIGCGADINPNPRREVAHAEQHGKTLADAADRVLATKMTPIAGRFGSAFEDVPLTFSRKPTGAEIDQALAKNPANGWALAMREQLRTKGDGILNYSYPVQAWTLGNLSWVALGGEVVVDYSLRLRRESPGNLWVFGYSTDVMAYIPNERVLKEGRYEGDTSMNGYGRPGPWTAGLEEKIVSKSHELVSRTRAAR